MNKILFILILIFGYQYLSYAQGAEQIAIDFYADKILPNKKKIAARYDGLVNTIDSTYPTLAKHVVREFLSCKLDPRGETNHDIRLTLEAWRDEYRQVESYDFTYATKVESRLRVPEKIIKKKKLKYNRLKGGFVSGNIERLWHLLFPVKYNISVEPSVLYKGYQFVWIKASKADLWNTALGISLR